MGWITDSGEHEGYVQCLFADGMAGGGWSDGGVTVYLRADGTEVPIEEQQSRPPEEIVGWRVACDCNGQSAGWLGSRWERSDVEDVAKRQLSVPANLLEDLTFDDGPHGRLLHDEWRREHLGSAYAELGDVRTAAQAAADARRDLDKTVAAARAAGASWSDIGAAAGMTRQSAHERWGR